MNVVDLNVSSVHGIDHDISDLLARETEDIQRGVVTRRACRILEGEPDLRKQEAEKFGQTCVEQSVLRTSSLWTSSRSLFAKAATSLALTSGAKPGNAITEVPRSANIATAERDLTILGAADLLSRSLGLRGSGRQQPERG